MRHTFHELPIQVPEYLWNIRWLRPWEQKIKENFWKIEPPYRGGGVGGGGAARPSLHFSRKIDLNIYTEFLITDQVWWGPGGWRGRQLVLPGQGENGKIQIPFSMILHILRNYAKGSAPSPRKEMHILTCLLTSILRRRINIYNKRNCASIVLFCRK